MEMHMKIGDIVVRKSYDKDIIFKIIDIKEVRGKTYCILKGLSIRIIADSPRDDLEVVDYGYVEEKEKILNSRVNEAMKKHTIDNPSFGYDDREIVSGDIIGTTEGSIFDPTQTEVTTAGDFQLVKTVAWYDNEYGFTCQMIRLLEKFANL